MGAQYKATCFAGGCLLGAIESKSDVLITGDKDFEGIDITGLKILKPASFIDRYRN